MAAPIPTTNTRQTGRRGTTIWHALWANTDQMTDTIVVDLSALSDDHTNSLTLERVCGWCTAGIEFALEFEATADELIMNVPLGATDFFDIDFTWGGREGLMAQGAGKTGDISITTLSAAAADEIYLVLYWKAS